MANVRVAPITKAELEEARQRGEAAFARGAASAYLDGGRLMLIMRNCALAGVDVSVIPCEAIARAPREKLQNVEVSPLGDYVWFPEVDEGFSVPALLDLSFGAAIRSRLGKLGGPKSSPAKVSAARANGKKGGRPRKRAA
jgi:hypothetical protein